VKNAAKKTAEKAVSKATPKPSGGSLARRLAAAAAKKAFKAIARRTLGSGAEVIREVADRGAGAGRSLVESGMSKRLPIQLSIDVAVPIRVAWDEWMNSGWLTEGVNRIEDVERDGDVLFGHTAGPHSRDWEAEIVDEREQESLAWRSVEGSDCAGLVTFHSLSDRLTRIELDLDVVPTRPSDAVRMGLHLAHRHAEADLRRFKAHVEFINPDVYEEDDPDASEEETDGSEEEMDGSEEEMDGSEEEMDGSEEEMDGSEEEMDSSEEEMDSSEDEMDSSEDEMESSEEDDRSAPRSSGAKRRRKSTSKD